ncbi:unnamed protein product [Peniophora sp. CBMAI 1063]|nr:unnamed protein product [Peniophora sp. CBMAI 1063]
MASSTITTLRLRARRANFDIMSVDQERPPRLHFQRLARSLDSASRTRFRTGVGLLTFLEKRDLLTRHPALREGFEKIKALNQRGIAGKELVKAKNEYRVMFRTASRAYCEAECKRDVSIQAKQNQLNIFAAPPPSPEPSSDADTAQAADEVPPLKHPNEYARVAHTPPGRARQYLIEHYALLPRPTRMVSFSTGLASLATGGICATCHLKVQQQTRVVLHVASCQAEAKLSEGRDLLPGAEWEPRACTTCPLNPTSTCVDTVCHAEEDFHTHVREFRSPYGTCPFCPFKSTSEHPFHLAQEYGYAHDGGFAEYRFARQEWGSSLRTVLTKMPAPR